MPKLNSRSPKYCKLKKYAVVYHHGKTVYLGLYDSPESWVAYARFRAEIQGNGDKRLMPLQSVFAISVLGLTDQPIPIAIERTIAGFRLEVFRPRRE
jgi:hypothetical protein